MRLAYEYAREYLAVKVTGEARIVHEAELHRLASAMMEYAEEMERRATSTASSPIRSDEDETELLYDEC